MRADGLKSQLHLVEMSGGTVSSQSKPIKIRLSLIPYVWKGFALAFLGLVIGVVASVIRLPLSLPFHAMPLVTYGGVVLIILGMLACLIGVVRRSMFSYLISDRDVVVQKQLLRRSVRRIPFSSISDLQVSQTLVGRLVGYGNIAPVTKSGYGLVHGMDRAEDVVQEMVNVPRPDKVADLIMSRVSTISSVRTVA